jgi:hypothetical protein
MNPTHLPEDDDEPDDADATPLAPPEPEPADASGGADPPPAGSPAARLRAMLNESRPPSLPQPHRYRRGGGWGRRRLA